jgi:hypothetical protein
MFRAKARIMAQVNSMVGGHPMLLGITTLVRAREQNAERRDFYELLWHTAFSIVWKGGAEREGQRSGKGVQGLPFGAGLGQRDAQRQGLGTVQVPQRQKAVEPFPVQPRESFGVVNPRRPSAQ